MVAGSNVWWQGFEIGPCKLNCWTGYVNLLGGGGVQKSPIIFYLKQ